MGIEGYTPNTLKMRPDMNVDPEGDLGTLHVHVVYDGQFFKNGVLDLQDEGAIYTPRGVVRIYTADTADHEPTNDQYVYAVDYGVSRKRK